MLYEEVLVNSLDNWSLEFNLSRSNIRAEF